jgi:hypothetical protein
MASTYKKGQVLRVKAVAPEGPVESIHMTDEGDIEYLISWVDADGEPHSRWFTEALVELVQ